MRVAISLLLICAAVLAGCTHGHLGCSENEIDADGKCTVADLSENNAAIFGEKKLNVSVLEVDYGPAIGYLAQPQEEGNFPAVIMIHEWWGLNENIKDMAKYLANEGYVVLAVDLYGGEVATESSKAGELAGMVRANQKKANENLMEAATFLRALKNVDNKKIASMGWCFGGGQSLQLALSGEDLAATIIYYGHLNDDKQALSAISQPVLGIFGGEDSSIPVSSVKSFKDSLVELEIENEIYVYEGVGHAFANPSGSRFAPAETKDAWEKTVQFLDKHLE